MTATIYPDPEFGEQIVALLNRPSVPVSRQFLDRQLNRKADRDMVVVMNDTLTWLHQEGRICRMFVDMAVAQVEHAAETGVYFWPAGVEHEGYTNAAASNKPVELLVKSKSKPKPKPVAGDPPLTHFTIHQIQETGLLNLGAPRLGYHLLRIIDSTALPAEELIQLPELLALASGADIHKMLEDLLRIDIAFLDADGLISPTSLRDDTPELEQPPEQSPTAPKPEPLPQALVNELSVDSRMLQWAEERGQPFTKEDMLKVLIGNPKIMALRLPLLCRRGRMNRHTPEKMDGRAVYWALGVQCDLPVDQFEPMKPRAPKESKKNKQQREAAEANEIAARLLAQGATSTPAEKQAVPETGEQEEAGSWQAPDQITFDDPKVHLDSDGNVAIYEDTVNGETLSIFLGPKAAITVKRFLNRVNLDPA